MKGTSQPLHLGILDSTTLGDHFKQWNYQQKTQPCEKCDPKYTVESLLVYESWKKEGGVLLCLSSSGNLHFEWLKVFTILHTHMSANDCQHSLIINLGIVNEFQGLQMNLSEWANSQIQNLWIVRIDYIQINTCLTRKEKICKATMVLVSGHEVVVDIYGFLLQLPVPYFCPQLELQPLWFIYLLMCPKPLFLKGLSA